jgi:hypothetical protein
MNYRAESVGRLLERRGIVDRGMENKGRSANRRLVRCN